MLKKISTLILVLITSSSLAFAANPVASFFEPSKKPANSLMFGQIESYYQLAGELNSKKIELEIAKKDPSIIGQNKEKQLQKEIQKVETGLAQTKIRLKNTIQNFGKKILFALSIWILAVILKWGIAKLFNRIDFYITSQRKAFILQLIKVVINTFAIIAMLLTFFSQLIQALPYFAIFATVITLALKDVILSVIAWIIIGTKDGYKVGHYLHVGNLWGTVVEINPFNTIVRQGGMSGPTGRLLTFPNKKIFEEFLENWSKWHNFTYLKWDFFLKQDSDIDKAEEILMQVLTQTQQKYKEKLVNKKNQLLNLGITEEDLEPMIFWEVQANGILLRGKLLVDFDDFFHIKTDVSKAFAKAISKEQSIRLRFVNNLIPNEF